MDPFDPNRRGGSPDPDWGRVDVTSRAGDNSGKSNTGLGDPILWGASDSHDVTINNTVVTSEQLVRVQAADNYARNWQLIGTLSADPAVWSSVTANGQWFALLQLTMGVGHTTLIHRVNLRALIDLAVSPVLAPTFNEWYVPVPEGKNVSYPWILPGGVLCNSLSAQILILPRLDAEAPDFTLPQRFSMSAMIAPFSAGAWGG